MTRMDTEKACFYLSVLELVPGATLRDVKTAYQELCLIWHPDKNPTRVTDRATRKQQLLNEAYQWLMQHPHVWNAADPEKNPHHTEQPLAQTTHQASPPDWWGQLDAAWQRIFHRLLQLNHAPTARDVARLRNVPELDCSQTEIQSLAPVQYTPDLRTLECDHTALTDLTPLRHLHQLQRLNCNATLIENLEPLRDLVNLQQLSCSGTRVRSLEPLQYLTNLQNLSIGETPVQSLEPLRSLTHLRVVYCSHTPITSLAPLRELPNLEVLYCLDTKVSLYEIGRFRTDFPRCKVSY